MRPPGAARLLVLLALASCGAAGCRTPARLGPPSDPSSATAASVVVEPRTITVAVSASTSAEIGAELAHPASGRGPGILIVPGAGDVSRRGLRPGDGVNNYRAPVAVSAGWAKALAARGAWVLSYDKRTCGPNDEALCSKNPQEDLDAEGPAALAKDVDAACALLRQEAGFDGRLVLLAHGQAAQVALSSNCAREANAIVLAAPIPRAVDEVIVAGLKERTASTERLAKAEKAAARRASLVDQAAQLRNLAGTREAEFASMKAGRFAPTARVAGATLAFWKGWIDVTSKTPALAEATPAKKIVVLGGKDLQYAAGDRKRIAALATDGFVELENADHHLLTEGALATDTVDRVGAAIDAAIGTPAS
jgi:hypothetical protein